MNSNNLDIDLLLQAMVGVLGLDKVNYILDYYQDLEREFKDTICCRCEEKLSKLKERQDRLQARINELERDK